MKRAQWFEFEDLPWVPSVVRDGGTDLLDLGFSLVKFYRPFAHSLVRALDESGGVSFAFFDVAASPALRKLPWHLAPVALALNMTMLSIATLALTPLLRPLRLSRLLLTYVVPLIPTLVAWDGTVSALRAYSPDELLEIARSIPGADRYTFAAEQQGPALSFTAIAPR